MITHKTGGITGFLFSCQECAPVVFGTKVEVVYRPSEVSPVCADAEPECIDDPGD